MTSEGVIIRNEVTNQGHSWWGAQLTHEEESLHISGHLNPGLYRVGNIMRHQVALAYRHMMPAELDRSILRVYTSNRRPSVGPVAAFHLFDHAEPVIGVGEPTVQIMPGLNRPATQTPLGRYLNPVATGPQYGIGMVVAQQDTHIAPDILRAEPVIGVGEPMVQIMPGLDRPATQTPLGRYLNLVTMRRSYGIAMVIAQQEALLAPGILSEKPEAYVEDSSGTIYQFFGEGTTVLSRQGNADLETEFERRLGRPVGQRPIGSVLLIRSTEDVAPTRPVGEPVTTDESPLHPAVESFSKGFAGVYPSDDTLETATMIVEAATRMVYKREIDVDETDGALSFQLRLETGYLVISELSVEGNLHANVYNDEDPNPNASIEDIWVKHLPQVSAADLIAWF